MTICIVTGSRSIIDRSIVDAAFDACGFADQIGLLVSGHQKGVKINGVWHPTVDLLAEQWAKEHGINVKEFPADWSQGKVAGFNRNKDMLFWAIEAANSYGTGVRGLACWDAISHGTGNMIGLFKAYHIEHYVYLAKNPVAV